MNKTLRSLLFEAEAKVKAAGLVATGCGIAVAALNDIEAHHEMLGSLPAWAQTVLLAVVPGVSTYLAAWKAKHTPRADLTVPTAAQTPPPAGGAAT